MKASCKIIVLLLFLAPIYGRAADARSYYEEGKALREKGEQVAAIRAFIRATHCETDNESLLGRVYSNMANMCRQANDHETAFEVYALSTEHFAKSYDSLAYAYAINNMAWEQAAMGHKAQALALVDSAVSLPLWKRNKSHKLVPKNPPKMTCVLAYVIFLLYFCTRKGNGIKSRAN